MPRRPRLATGNYLYHVLNRAVGKSTLFETEGDYAAFLRVIEEAHQQVPVRLLAFCVMPNHWHLVLWPKEDGDLSEYMRWLTVTHTGRWHKAHRTTGTGPIYQGRFKSFPIQGDDHFYTVTRLCGKERFTSQARTPRRSLAVEQSVDYNQRVCGSDARSLAGCSANGLG